VYPVERITPHFLALFSEQTGMPADKLGIQLFRTAMEMLTTITMTWGLPMMISAVIAFFFIVGLFFAAISNPPKAD
jgi:hypothetical protein